MAEPIRSYWDVVEPVWNLIDIDTPAAFSESTARVPRPVLLLYAAHFCLSEISNGGFFQFFWNSTGLIAPESAQGFTAIGMTKLASVVSAAAALLGAPYPRDRKERWDSLLAASGREEADLKKIFAKSSNLYAAFYDATKSLHLEVLDKQFWELAGTESGGFDEAANRYAQSFSLI